MPLGLAVLLSGGGTTLQNIIDHIERGELDAKIHCVVASRRDAYGLVRARNHNIPHTAIVRGDFPDAAAFRAATWAEIRRYPVDLVALAGYMCLLDVPPDFANRIINVHPALIPAFCGKGMYGHHVHEAVIAYGAKISGATVHIVDTEYDHGPIIIQEAVPVFDDDTPDSLAERVQAKEREIYPRAIQWFAEGRVRVEGRRVKIA
ncbi:MAG TPA: phosphoribosylglycinamide formyltransferase [Candidatus Hydrogenedentes bacterium]|nr:phosphoribosylglycinamide formyltransferase [Candidatus Hydrogenedentota bacterium]HOV72546.1 phosphoribosylglycinamide formyltransferase [Candidatus Hydrogenedentota bacterium]HPC15291.1 phosphoribosylglycinamide formyltransferase [Candidatus Hydrogenedentota bacterium]HRT19246.1 phosphoribosylglycinamide formyltransferase [Candidatus Hydrogenedentota bacterium]HRT63326.1 phosphoribosylglycinamide formyltransferase [Candidatus Hydrogenedentota bacterium]